MKLAGSNSEEELVQVQEHIIGLLESSKCVLKNWASNSSQVLDNIPSKGRAQRPSFDPEDIPSIKVLDLHWDPYAVVFGYNTNSQDEIDEM